MFVLMGLFTAGASMARNVANRAKGAVGNIGSGGDSKPKQAGGDKKLAKAAKGLLKKYGPVISSVVSAATGSAEKGLEALQQIKQKMRAK